MASLSAEQRERLTAEVLRRYPALAAATGRLAGFVELREGRSADGAELLNFVRRRLPEHMTPDSIAPLDRLPRTRSGKIDRKQLEGMVAAPPQRADAGAAPPRDETERTLAAIWCAVLDLEAVTVNDDFFEVGGDSLLSIRVLSRAARAGIGVSPQRFFENPTIAGMAAAARSSQSGESGPVTGEAPLTPIQHWFFENIPAEQHHWNQSVLLALGAGVSPAAVESAVSALLRRHDALRLRFARGEAGWRQIFDPPLDEAALRVEDLSGTPAGARGARIEAVASEVQAAGDLERGHLARFVLFDFGDGEEKRLLAAIHHLLVDNFSWTVLLEDLEALLQGRGLPPNTVSYKQWAESLVERAADPVLQERRRFWLEQHESASATRGQWPWVDDAERQGPGETRTIELGEDTTRRLVNPPDGVQTQDLLLTALLEAWHAWSGCSELFVDLEGHGRDVVEGLETSRSVGWFTTVFPVTLRLEENALGAVRRQLRAMPDRGASHGLLRYLSDDRDLREALCSKGRPAVLFNYLGAQDAPLAGGSVLQAVDGARGPERSPRTRRAYALEINAWVEAGRLRFRWTHDANREAREAAGAWSAAFERELSAAPDTGFTMAGLSGAVMDRLSGLLEDDE